MLVILLTFITIDCVFAWDPKDHCFRSGLQVFELLLGYIMEEGGNQAVV